MLCPRNSDVQLSSCCSSLSAKRNQQDVAIFLDCFFYKQLITFKLVGYQMIITNEAAYLSSYIQRALVE